MDYPKSTPNVGLVGGKFVDENVGTGTPGSLIPAIWGNAVTDELLAVIKAAGIVPTEGDLTQLLKAIQAIAASDIKRSVRVATTGPIALSGLQTIDGVALKAGDRVLAKNQATASQNWIYTVAAGAWVRALDANESAECTPGHVIIVEAGTVNAGSLWQLSNTTLPTLGTTALNFSALVGKTGVVAGDYNKVTVDAQGRVIAGSNPTTVGESGLTDVYTKAEINASLAGKAPIESPVFTGNPRVPTVEVDSRDYSAVNTFWARRLLAQYGLGHNNGGVIPATQEELGTLLSGNYYYPSAISPYGSGVFTQRMVYAANRGFEISNYPYQKRIFGRVSNNDGTWQAPFELANLDSPAFTGIPTCPTAAKGTNTLQQASTAFVQAAISSLVDTAPGALDTLKELAAALGNDPSFSTTVLNALAQKLEQADIGYGGYALDYPGNDLNTWVNKSAIYRLKAGALGIPPGFNPQGSIVQHEVWGIGVGQQTVREHATGREWHRSVDQNFSTEWFENTSNMAGAVVAFAMNAAPTGFLIANGAAVSRTSYPLLFSRIGTQFGAGNGSTTFNLPDLRAEVIRGLDAGRGVDAGRVFSTVQLDALQGHGHQNTAMRIGASGGDGELLSHNNGKSSEVLNGRITAPVDLAGYGAVRIATETRMRNIALLYCIKY